MRALIDGVVRGIGTYGNCMGIPTVGGETRFHAGYNQNILVNAFALGVARRERIFRAKASGAGNSILYVGSRTGRDGIHGASMASESFDSESAKKKPTVQVGDPFVEKILLEACLEAMRSTAIVAIQDMGAAGLTSSIFEMAARGSIGFRARPRQVPLREPGLSAYEMMLSESQERMVLVVKRGREEEIARVFRSGGSRSRRSASSGPERAPRSATAAESRPRCRSRRSPTTRRSTSARSRCPPISRDGKQAPEVPAGHESGRDARGAPRLSRARQQGVDLAPVRLHGAHEYGDRAGRRRGGAAAQGHAHPAWR